jgi:TP901 family phage tail tape measure protein
MWGKLKSALSLIGFGLQSLGTPGIRSFAAIRDGAGQVLGVLLKLAAAAALVGAGIAVAIGVMAVKAAGQFQTAMLSLVAHAGLAQSQFNNVSKSVLAMATTVGRSPTELAEALYPILSSFSDISNQGAKTALSLQTLKLSFETVAGTTTSGTAVANTAVSVFHALGLATNNTGLNASRMSALFDLMDKSVQDGNMSWDAYRGTIGKVALAIQGTNVKFTEANAALDVLTASGFPSARQAGTSLTNLLTEMVIKQDAVATKAKGLKIAFDSQAFGSMNLAQRIAYLNTITHGNQAELLKLLSGSSAALKAFNALANNSGKYAANLKDLGHSQGALAASFATASQGFQFSLSKIGAAGQVLLITIGQRLLPTLTDLAQKVTPIIAAFAAWIVKNDVVGKAINGVKAVLSVLGPILQTVGGFVLALAVNLGKMVGWFLGASAPAQVLKALLVGIGFAITAIKITQFLMTIPALVAGFIAWAAGAGAAAIATLAATWPILAIGAVIAVVVAGVILAIQHWGAIGTWLHNVWNTVTSAIGRFFAMIGGWVHNLMGVFGKLPGPVKVAIAVLLLPLAIILAPIIGIALAITHLGDVFAALGNQAAIMRDQVGIAHTQMRLKVDQETAKSAALALSHLETERQGLLTKLKAASTEQERERIRHELAMVNEQIAGQQQRLSLAQTDATLQLARQKALHAQLVEDQKNWFVRLLDDILGFFGSVFGAIGNFVGTIMGKLGQFKDWVVGKFQDMWNGIVSIFQGIGTWFGQRVTDVQTAFGNVGKFFQGIGQAIFNGLTGPLKGLGTWFQQNVAAPIENIWNGIKSHLPGGSPTTSSGGPTTTSSPPGANFPGFGQNAVMGSILGAHALAAHALSTGDGEEEGNAVYDPNAWHRKKKAPVKKTVVHHRKKPVGGTLGGVSAPTTGGVYTSTGGSSIGGGSGNTYYIVINSSVNVAMPKGSLDQQATALANKVDAELGVIYRKLGLDSTVSSGSAA